MQTSLRRNVQHPVDPGMVLRVHGHRFVARDTVSIEPVVARPSAKRFTHRHVLNAGRRQRRRKLLLREPRAEAGVGDGAHVSDQAHAGVSQQRQKSLQWHVRMANGEQVAGVHIG